MSSFNQPTAVAAADRRIAYMLEAGLDSSTPAASWERKADAIEREIGFSLPHETRRVMIARLLEDVWDEWPGFYEMALDNTRANIALNAETARNLGLPARPDSDEKSSTAPDFLPATYEAVPAAFVDTMHALRAAIHAPQTPEIRAKVDATIGEEHQAFALAVLDRALEFLTREWAFVWDIGFGGAAAACCDLARLFNREQSDTGTTLKTLQEAARHLEGLGPKADSELLHLARVALPDDVADLAPALFELVTNPPNERVARAIARRFYFVPWDPSDLPDGVESPIGKFLYKEGVKHPVTGEVIRWLDHPVGKLGAEVLPGAIPLLSAMDRYPGAMEDYILDDGYFEACCDYYDGYQVLALVCHVLRHDDLAPYKVRAALSAAHELLRRPRPPTPAARERTRAGGEWWNCWKTVGMRRHHDGERYLARVIELKRKKPGISLETYCGRIAAEETNRRLQAHTEALAARRAAIKRGKRRRGKRPPPPGTVSADEVKTAILRFRKIFETA